MNPFLIVSQHPVTTEYGKGEGQIFSTLEAVSKTGIPSIVLWPNADAGSDDLSRGIRKWRELNNSSRMYFFKNLPVDDYIILMKLSSCLVGNSSSGIREGAFIGTPVVNIGTRQDSRERGNNVVSSGYDSESIHRCILHQVEHGPYASQPIYGDGNSGRKIADILASTKITIQKTITY